MQIIGASIEHKSQLLGMSAPSTLFDLDEAANLLENEHNGTASLELMKDKQRRLIENLEKCETELCGLKKKLSEVTRELDGALEDWKSWLLQNRLSPSLSPESFDSFSAAVRAARANLNSLGVMRSKLAGRRGYEASVEARISELGVKTGLKLDKGSLPALFRSLKEALSLQARIDASLEDRRAADFECSELEKELAAAVGSVRALCEEAGTDSEEGLRAAFEKHALRLTLENRLAKSRRALAGIFGGDASDISEAEFLTDALTTAREAEVLRLDISDGEKALDALRDACGALEAQMETVAPDDRIFTLRQRNETLKILAQKGFRRWLAAVLLRRFAEKAALRHEKGRESEALKLAQQFMSLMAGSKWKIVPDGKRGEGRDFCVALERDTDGIRLDETQWSMGLAEQVALSMKLAMAYRLGERPMMLDDALTRFDESRQLGAIEALWRASEKFQVIFFTCHRSTADIFRSRLAGEKEFSVVEMRGNASLIDNPKARAKRLSKRR